MTAERDVNGRFIKGSKVNKGRVPSADQRRKQREKMQGRSLSDDHRRKIKEGMGKSGKSIGHPKGMSAWNKGIEVDCRHLHTPEVRQKISQSNTGKICNQKTREKLSRIVKEWWKNPENAKKCLSIDSPNKMEMKLNGILDQLFPGEWMFVGDGKVVIDGKCPDFINVNGQKKIIELYGERWHRNDDPQARADIFKPFGYETLVIWSRELWNKERLQKKLEVFCVCSHTDA